MFSLVSAFSVKGLGRVGWGEATKKEKIGSKYKLLLQTLASEANLWWLMKKSKKCGGRGSRMLCGRHQEAVSPNCCWLTPSTAQGGWKVSEDGLELLYLLNDNNYQAHIA